ncbi:uncharacterized protein EV420DRAFT_1564720 [Desarmillaria tabescens]|uniref:Uncharacterized protein n=1 Tax=Armillaria tabescens TaxID=1929756 RepID=A0AA39JXC2_ARMTA|nr:uncharacterized protein EV420DRAFT_1564720 [Desarmillaria tabescens]KAK0449565.1 hypothetical protein EV420DRAFT_1564720 [Desarmillaria tabescens]
MAKNGTCAAYLLSGLRLGFCVLVTYEIRRTSALFCRPFCFSMRPDAPCHLIFWFSCCSEALSKHAHISIDGHGQLVLRIICTVIF